MKKIRNTIGIKELKIPKWNPNPIEVAKVEAPKKTKEISEAFMKYRG